MKPSTSLLNFTPSSYAPVSAALEVAGTADGPHKLVHGHAPATTVTVTPAPADSRLPLSSTARLRSVAVPSAPGDQSKLHGEVPCAARHVVPPSMETSTLATVPPPASTAVPLIVTRFPLWTCPPAAGDAMVES